MGEKTRQQVVLQFFARYHPPLSWSGTHDDDGSHVCCSSERAARANWSDWRENSTAASPQGCSLWNLTTVATAVLRRNPVVLTRERELVKSEPIGEHHHRSESAKQLPKLLSKFATTRYQQITWFASLFRSVVDVFFPACLFVLFFRSCRFGVDRKKADPDQRSKWRRRALNDKGRKKNESNRGTHSWTDVPPQKTRPEILVAECCSFLLACFVRAVARGWPCEEREPQKCKNGRSFPVSEARKKGHQSSLFCFAKPGRRRWRTRWFSCCWRPRRLGFFFRERGGIFSTVKKYSVTSSGSVEPASPEY